MSIAAVVPVKPLSGALGRLGSVLDVTGRRALQAAMLRDVLGACRAAQSVTRTLVVTSDPEAAAIARECEAEVMSDHDPPLGMNAAVELGLERATTLGMQAALVLTADLPRARAADLEAVRRALPAPTGVALSPSLDGTGTNAMLLAPPGVLRPELGIGSLARHLAQAERLGIPVGVVRRAGLALDVDTPEDLAHLCEHPGASHADELCVRLDLDERIAVGVR